MQFRVKIYQINVTNQAEILRVKFSNAIHFSTQTARKFIQHKKFAKNLFIRGIYVIVAFIHSNVKYDEVRYLLLLVLNKSNILSVTGAVLLLQC